MFTILSTVSGTVTPAAIGETLDVAGIVTGSDFVSGTVASVGDVSASAPAGFMEACAEGGGWSLMLMYVVIIGLAYFLFMRPQRNRQKKEEAMRKSVEIGDEITTIGGICGRVVSMKEDDSLIIETGTDRAKLRIKTWAVGSNQTVKDTVEADGEGGKVSKFFGNLFKKQQ